MRRKADRALLLFAPSSRPSECCDCTQRLSRLRVTSRSDCLAQLRDRLPHIKSKRAMAVRQAFQCTLRAVLKPAARHERSFLPRPCQSSARRAASEGHATLLRSHSTHGWRCLSRARGRGVQIQRDVGRVQRSLSALERFGIIDDRHSCRTLGSAPGRSKTIDGDAATSRAHSGHRRRRWAI